MGKIRKITSGINLRSGKSKASVLVVTSGMRKNLNIPFTFSLNRKYTKSSLMSEKLLYPNGLLRKILAQDKYLRIEMTKIEL